MQTLDSDSKGSLTNSKTSSSHKEESRQIRRKKDMSSGTKQVPRMTYSLGQGNRHHQKLLEMMDNSGVDSNQADNERHENLRMTMMRVVKQHERWSQNSSAGSTNTSTRNTNLGAGRRRESQNSTGADTIGSNILGDENLDAFLCIFH